MTKFKISIIRESFSCNKLLGREKVNHVMRYSILLLTCLLFFAGCKSKPPDLAAISNKIESITVYDIEGLSGDKYTVQELQEAFQASIKPEEFRALVPAAQYEDDWVLWKGSRLAVAQLDNGKKQLLALSYYGGFFKLLGDDGYFYFDEEARKKWGEIFSKGIIQENFIPKRIERNKRREERKKESLNNSLEFDSLVYRPQRSVETCKLTLK